jgi:hypothetical protein
MLRSRIKYIKQDSYRVSEGLNVENDQEMEDLKALYDELAQNGKRLAKDIRKSIDFYLLLGAISLLLTFFSFTVVGGYSYYILSGITVAGGLAAVILFSIVSLILLGSGIWLVRLYYTWRIRYKGLLEMERKWSKVDG